MKHFCYPLNKSALIALVFLSTQAFSDFQVPTTAYRSSTQSEAACQTMRDETAIDRKKASAALIWTALCNPAVVKAFIQNEGLYTFDGNTITNTLDNTPAPYQDVLDAFFLSFGQDVEVESGVPGETLPMTVRTIPLLTYDLTSVPNIMNAWTGLPKDMPIGSLLKDEKSYALFCASAVAPTLILDSGFITCDVSEAGDDSVTSLPSLPPTPRGKDQKLQTACHHLRIEAARSGQISHQELFDLTAENTVPEFTDINNFESTVIGIEPCSQRHRTIWEGYWKRRLEASRGDAKKRWAKLGASNTAVIDRLAVPLKIRFPVGLPPEPRPWDPNRIRDVMIVPERFPGGLDPSITNWDPDRIPEESRIPRRFPRGVDPRITTWAPEPSESVGVRRPVHNARITSQPDNS
ncbi:MAG: hypothetical protein EOP04_12305 [Proteobacteria bacterium]|nr:MAG: hypothetical protein EOP04_12305 [Pseudomonadota bacterium]